VHDFLASLAPESFTVLGRSLLPLSYGHVILLNRFDLDPVSTPIELILAVNICQRSFQDGFNWFGGTLTPQGQRQLEKEAERIGLGVDYGKRSFQAWSDYVEANSSSPEWQQTDRNQGTGDRGAPFLAQLRIVLMRDCNYSPEYILDAPYGQCLWDYGAAIEDRAGWGIRGEKQRWLDEVLNN